MRGSVGVCDVSTLGKIDLQGPDAAEFLDRLYTNTWTTLAVGRARYGLMLREDGFVLDDGTTSRLAEDRFVVTTTTANAAKVLQHMEFCHQWLWPDLDVQFSSVSEQWAQFSVAGPRSRDVLRKIVDAQHDISNAAFPYMAAAEMTAMGGIPARLFRISFSGELAYEIAVPAGYGDALIRRIMEAGREFGIAPYGTEALGVMRIEKGHVAGNEINGQTTARDLGLGRMMSTRKDYIGRRHGAAPGPRSPPTGRRFVGFKPVDRDERLRAGAHFIRRGREAGGRQRPGLHDLGRVLAHARPLDRPRPPGAAGRRAMASACARTIPCATATCWSRCAIPSSTILPESACVGETANLFVSALDGVVTAGRYGRRTGDPGVIVERSEGRGPGNRHRPQGPARSPRSMRRESAFGVELPSLPRRVEGRDIAFIWSGPDQWLAYRHPAPAEGMEAACWRRRSPDLPRSSTRAMGARSCA